MNPNEYVASQVATNARRDPLLWAKRIMERVERGDRTVLPIAKDMAEKALKGRV